jgi:hypothetical protein
MSRIAIYDRDKVNIPLRHVVLSLARLGLKEVALPQPGGSVFAAAARIREDRE